MAPANAEPVSLSLGPPPTPPILSPDAEAALRKERTGSSAATCNPSFIIPSPNETKTPISSREFPLPISEAKAAVFAMPCWLRC